MKWFIFGLFLFGALCEVAAWLGFRNAKRNGQSADVALGNYIGVVLGLCIWELDLIILVIWSLVKN